MSSTGEQLPPPGFAWLVVLPASSGSAGTHEVTLAAARLGDRMAGLEHLADELRGERARVLAGTAPR